ncbi:hypothetical protein [Hubei odonate virus 4]|uniref:hypothetical protein n=1 Tax=Hubei odonate virus 4 TaxID=1922999 RepID=UPI00090B8E79|nr:hypothetical protein [Hubei odonate virus 4]APG78008.1 hypothetical protein [Hubei odonate virus 4]
MPNFVKSTVSPSLSTLVSKMSELIVPEGWIVVGKKSESIPLLAMDLYKLLDADERKLYCDALVREVFLPAPTPDFNKVNRVEFAEEVFEDVPLDYVKSHETSKRLIKKKSVIPESGPFKQLGHTNTWYLDYAAWEFRPRTMILRLRNAISNKRQKADVYAFVRRKPACMVKEPVAFPEMESNPGPPEDTVVTSNVVLGETQVESSDVADLPKSATWHELSTTEENPSYSNLTDRFTFWKSFEWSTDKTDILISNQLPHDFVNSYDRCKMPMFIPFQIHQYMRGDMEIKLHINSNKFQAGQLIAAWFYGTVYEHNDRSHIADLVQLPHVIISAGASNEATLTIPYRYHVAYMNTKVRDGFLNPLSMGSLIVRPLVPLSTSATGSKSCNISIFIRFTSVAFTGMIDGSLANPEMDLVGNLVQNAAKLLNAPNCDNPPLNTPPRYLVPTAAHSWSMGNGLVEPLHRLSLQRSIGFKHVDDTEAEDMTHGRIVNKFGLLKTITWNSADVSMNKTGHILWACNVHPQIDKHELYTYIGDRAQLIAYYVPPCGVISSMYEYWRGTLEFKFDFVATSFHTGRVLVAYIPGIKANRTVTLEQARNSAHVVFSLQDSSTFTFTVPYISDRPWWKRKYGGPQRRSEFDSPSALFMFVLNPLIPMESVSKSISIVPYVRAGLDFELAVPVQPSVGLGWNTANSSPGTQKIQFKSGYYPVYVGQWHNFGNSERAIFRYGNVSDHIAQLDKYIIPSDRSKIYVFTPNVKMMAEFKNPDGNGPYSIQEITYGVPYQEDDYVYMVPFPSLVFALDFARKYAVSGASGISVLAPFSKTDSSFTAGNVVWTPSEYDLHSRDSGVQSGFEVIAYPEMERELNPSVMQPTSSLKTTGGGDLTFGENFSDLKDLCRRYQLYWDGKVTPPTDVKRDYALLQCPIRPQGLDLSVADRPMWNIARDGHIPLIASGFRYYRGGIRVRIIITNFDGIVWIQYRSDRPLDHESKVVTGSNIKAADRYRNHSYPYYIQDLRINRIIEIELPYYQPGIFGVLGQTSYTLYDKDLNNFTSLGDLVIGIEGSSIPKDIEIALYYSVADDFSMNTYIGFPPMVFCDETAQPEMEFASGMIASLAGTIAGKVVTTPIKQKSKEMKEALISEIVMEAQKKIEPMLTDMKKSVEGGKDQIVGAFHDSVVKQALANAVGQLLQVVVNPTPASLAIAVCSLIGSLVVVSLELIMSLQKLFVEFLSSIWTKYFVQSNDLPEDVREASPEGGDEEATDNKYNVSLFTMIFGLVATTLGLSCRQPKDYVSFTKGMKEDLGLANNASLFFKNSIDAIIYCYEYCAGETSDIARARKVVSQNYPSLKSWVDDVVDLLDPRRRRLIFKSSKEANRVFDSCQYGALIIKANIDKSCPGGKVIFDLYTKICKLRDDLVQGGNHPNVRFEPFPIYVVGEAGRGKSYLTTAICKEMLQHIGYRSSEEMIYWLQLGQKYWNGIGNPAVVARDEAYAVDGTFTEEEIQVHMAMCSVSVFNPPMAAIEDKNKRINPLIYYMNSNVSFPSFVSARCPQAIYRRRKLLIEVNYTRAIKEKYPNIMDASQISEEDRVNNQHLCFRIARNPSDPSTEYTENLSYQQCLEIIKAKFKDHYEKEQVKFRQRMHDNYCLDPEYDESDNLDFITEISRSNETLKERLERERESLQDRIDEYSLENEDPFFQRMWQKAKERFRTVFPEVETAVNNTSFEEQLNRAQRGFMTEDRREQVAMLIDRLKLDRGAVQKIMSGVDITSLSEEDIAGFSMMEDFLPVVENPDRHYQYWVGTHHCAFFKVLGSQTWGASEIAHKDASIFGKWSKRLQPHWKERTGIPALKAYVFWLVRQAQWLDILSKYNLDEHIEKLREMYKQEIYDLELDDVKYEDLVNEPCGTFLGSNAMETYMKPANRLAILLTYLKKSGMSRTVCEHCKVWGENIHDTSRVKYNARLDKLLFEDTLGYEFSIPCKCTCNNNFSRLSSNKLFIRAMKIIWNHDHGTVEDNDTNPFRFTEYESIRDDARSFLTRTVEWIKDWWTFTGKPQINYVLRFLRDHALAIITALIGCWALYSSYTAKTPAKKVASGLFGAYYARAATSMAFMEAGANYYRDAGVPRRGFTATRPAAREYGEIDVNVEKKIMNNVCFIKCSWLDEVTGNRREIKGRCLGIRNRQVLVIKHYFEEFAKYKDIGDFQLFLYKNGKECAVELKWVDFAHIKYLRIAEVDNTSNFGILELPKYVPMFTNIINYFPSIGMHKNVRSEADFISVNGPSKRGIRIEKSDYLLIAGDDDITAIQMDAVYKYGHHGPSLCGSILLSPGVCNGNIGIIGMHVAGRSGVGFAEPICREWFDSCPPKEKVEYVLPEFNDMRNANVELDGNMIFYGCVSDAFAHKESGKTQIIPSLLHDQIYDVKTEPNPLRPNDPRQPPGSHPLRDGCNKHGVGYPGKFDEEILDLVNVDSREILINECKPILTDLKPFSYQDAICGNPQIPMCEALNWNSSEGFPLSNYRPAGTSGKKWLFDLEESEKGLKLKGLHPRLESLLSMRECARERDVVLPSIYVDCLKDYRLTPEKCKIPGKTRIFSIAPVQTTIDTRRYMGNFLCSYKFNTIKAEHGIGINCDSMQWTELVHYLTAKGSHIITGDYSNFGPSLSSQLVSAVIEDILYWHKFYGASEKHLKHLNRILSDEIITPIHLCSNVVYQPLNGIGSGSPITAELNSEVNKKYVKYAWIEIMRKEKIELANMESFHQHCRLVTYGDDFICSVSDELKEIFNCVTIGECLKKYGVTLTSADKGTHVRKFDHLTNSTFLKRSFKKHPNRIGVWLAPIEKQSITECLNWCHKSNDIRFATEEVIRASLDLAFGHGPEFYAEHAERINQALRIHDLRVSLKSWITRDKDIFGD